MDGCIFCRVAAGQIPAEKVLENELFDEALFMCVPTSCHP